LRVLVSIFLLSISLFGECGCKPVPCIERTTTLFENKFEKIFEYKNRIYKIQKGDDRRDSIMMILDEERKEYIVIDIFEESEEDTLDLM
jgi:hypothetical protein